MVRLIGISGATGSGKDTMARIIQNSCLDSLPPEYRLSLEEVTTVSKINNPERLQILEEYSKWRHVKFGSNAKKMYSILYGINENYLETREFKHQYNEDFNCTGVEHFIYFAQTMKKNFGEDLWLDSLFRKYKGGEDGELPFWVISDLRFPNEYERIKKEGGITVRINKKSNDLIQLQDNNLTDYQFDYEIENDGTLTYFLKNIIKFVSTYNLR